jgi:alpha-mannosidase
VSGSAKTLRLPDNDKIRILAISTADGNPELDAAQPLYDTLNGIAPPNLSAGTTR